jgi:hypothetical protein
MNILIQFYHEAKSKVTTYVALAIATLAQVAEHAEDAYNSWPQIAGYLPSSHLLVSASHYALSALGILAVYTRVRRLLGTK